MRVFTLLSVLQVTLASLLGIDFGTEFSKSALVAPNVPFEIVLTPDSKRKDASGLVLKLTGDGIERIYGTSGTSLASRFSDSALYFLKPLLGCEFGEPEIAEFNRLHPGLELVSTSRHTVGVKIGKEVYPLEEILGFSLKETRGRAEELLKARLGQSSVRDAALTVPPQFTMTQRQALIDAANLAGFDVAALVNDGVAVGVNYVSTRAFGPEPVYVVVYDMGSESTSCTLMAISEEDGVKKLAVSGLGVVNGLGGKHVTSALQSLLLDRFAELIKTSSAELQTTRILSRLWREAERVKAVLSANTEVTVHVESLYNDVDFNTFLTRSELEELVKPLLDRVQDPLKQALQLYDGSELPVAALDSVILTGGATRMPAVQKGIRDLAGDIISKNVNADEAGALGAALRGVAISGIFKSKPIEVIDRTPYSYSVAVNGATERVPMFAQGSELNTQYRLNFTLAEELQDATITLFEDEKELVTWTIPQAGLAVETLEEEDGDKCVDDIMVEASFLLSHSNVVQLTDAYVRCHGAPEAAEQEEDELLEAAPGAEPSVEPTNRQPLYKRAVGARPKWAGAQPLTSPDRQQLMYHMRSLDSDDAERLRRQTLHNQLESLLYRAREALPDNEIVSECLEWLETESGTVVQLTERMKRIKKLLSGGSGLKKRTHKTKSSASADATEPVSAETTGGTVDESNTSSASTASNKSTAGESNDGSEHEEL